MICNFPLLLSHSKNIQMSNLIRTIITYHLLIINYYYYNNNYRKSQKLLQCKSYGVMFIKFVDID